LRVASGQFEFSVNGLVGPDCELQNSTNLTTWDIAFTTNSPRCRESARGSSNSKIQAANLHAKATIIPALSAVFCRLASAGIGNIRSRRNRCATLNRQVEKPDTQRESLFPVPAN
jgi:hypothetical protein